jgi:predicted  nucleic acid-binding Zn-ribbon protein
MADASAVTALLALQDLDTRADQLRHRRAHLTETVSRAELEAAETASRAEHDQVDSRRRELVTIRDEGEATTQVNDRHRRDLDRKLSAATTAREADALSAELASLAERQSSLDDHVLEALVELEDVEDRLGVLARRLDDLAARLVVARADEAVAAGVVEAELDDLAAQRTGLVAAVPEALLARYERLRARHRGIGVARVVERHCSGCNLAVPSAELEELRHLPPGEVGECGQCGRMLVP